MRYVAAYLLAAMSGHEPSKDAIKKILGSVGIDCDDERVNKLLSEMKGKSAEEVIAAGQKKLASVPSGGAASAGAAAAPAAATAKPEAKAAEAAPAKKEEKKESEDEDEDMGFGLFD